MTKERIQAQVLGRTFTKFTETGERFIAIAQADGWDKPVVRTFKTADCARDWACWMHDMYNCNTNGFAKARVI